MDGLIQPGRTIRFDYPAHNYKGARRRMERRCLRVEHVRPLAAQPLAAITTQLDPQLDRGEVLVTGKDLDKRVERSFYFERMERVEEVAIATGGNDFTYSVGMIDVDELEVVEREMDRDSADGLAFGFNGQAVADGSNVRAVVLADCDV